MITYLILYLLIGALAGTMSGLLGIGGGIVVVPALEAIFLYTEILPPDLTMKMAIGTSLAIMVITLSSSVYAHHKRLAVNWKMVKTILPGLILGVVFGTILVRFLPSHFLKIFFSIFLICISLQMLFKKTGDDDSIQEKKGIVFPRFLTWIFAILIGFLSSILGTGGGVLWVPFFLHCHVRMQDAVGTSVACAIVTAFFATIVFIIAGLMSVQTLPWSTGYIYWPAFLGVSLASVLFAPIGAAIAHQISSRLLKKIFAVFLIFVAIDMMLLK